MPQNKNRFYKFIFALAAMLMIHCCLFAQNEVVDSTKSVNPAEGEQGAPVTDVSGDDNGEHAANVLGTAMNPKNYYIRQITVSGTQYLEADLIVPVTGLVKGQALRMPDDQGITKAIKTLWGQGMFANVSIDIARVEGDSVDLNITLEERPRLSGINFYNIGKSDESQIKEKLGVVKGRMVTEAMKKDLQVRIIKYYEDKGFAGTAVNIYEKRDTGTTNAIYLYVYVTKGRKIHINNINFSGNDNVAAGPLKRAMKDTKEMARLSVHSANDSLIYTPNRYSFKDFLRNKDFLSPSRTLSALSPYLRPRFFSSSKFNEKKFEADKSNVIEYYNTQGYRDAQIVQDTIYAVKNGNINIEMKVKEGHRYYFGKLYWEGNTIYSEETLDSMVGIRKGDVYDRSRLDKRLTGGGPEGDDVYSLYQDQGYLFSQINPSEKAIYNDTIDFDIRVVEGPQATIKNVTISGNDRTNDYVIRRELYVYPGDKYSRANIIRSIRMVSNLGYIDGQSLQPDIQPNQNDGTVDIGFPVTEKSSDQLELSAGYGGGIGFTGTIGITFNNFSLKNFFHFKDWEPLPMGDGQKLSLRYQSSGKYYNTASFSFTEPWLGGKKPTALMFSGTYGKYTLSFTDKSDIINFGGGVSISKRLKWPDDNFNLSYGINYMRYVMHNYAIVESLPDYKTGASNNLNLSVTLSRYTLDMPTFPTSGSNFSLTATATPPYSSFTNKNYALESDAEKYKLLEYYKFKFIGESYQKLGAGFILRLVAKFGLMGYYNKDIGYSPFERFQIGGDGLSGYNYFVGRDVVAQRGYDIYARDATIFNKFTAEVRFPFSLSPSATIFGLAFFEAGNGYYGFKAYDPFDLKKAIGIGVRVNLPMFGLLGLDYGIGLNNLTDQLGNKRSIGAAAKFTFMMGMEPQ